MLIKQIIGTMLMMAALRLAQQGPPAGGAAPAFTVKDLAGGEFQSSQLKGSIVVLDFWATWCEPCIEDIPMFNRIHDKYQSRGVKVVGIAVQSGWVEDIKRHVATLTPKYLVLAGDDNVMQQYVTVGFPTTYLIGPNGAIVKKYVGSVPEGQPDKEMDLVRQIDTLLTQRGAE